MATVGSEAEGISSPVDTDTLKIEEVQAPATGTRKAKVLYDYDAADSSELSLLADEVRCRHYCAASDSDIDHEIIISLNLGLTNSLIQVAFVA